jgi:hypothetical protein
MCAPSPLGARSLASARRPSRLSPRLGSPLQLGRRPRQPAGHRAALPPGLGPALPLISVAATVGCLACLPATCGLSRCAAQQLEPCRRCTSATLHFSGLHGRQDCSTSPLVGRGLLHESTVRTPRWLDPHAFFLCERGMSIVISNSVYVYSL